MTNSGLSSHWWRPQVIYQVYPRSFADSTASGTGDLGGIIDRLDHLEWLGVDALWLSPITTSPDADWGYDVADFCDVDPDFGSLEVLDRLIAEAGRRGIRILLDLVPNHTSNRHRWFLDALSSPESRYRDFYVWVDANDEGTPPNNWVSSFGGPAWSLDAASQQWYLHNFLPEQPDLNWWNPEVREEFDRILRFWWDRGIAGFRIDVCSVVIKDAELRDNPPSDDTDSFTEQIFGQRFVYNANRPEVHEVIRHWRTIAESYDPPRLLLGETNVEGSETLASYYGGGDELQLAFNFPFIESPFEAEALSSIVEEMERLLGADDWPVWTGSNHDVSRLATRWADGDPTKVRLALLMLLTLRGTPVLYQGDEIGLVDGGIEFEDLRDPVGWRYWPHYKGRDPERTPMSWNEEPQRGFTTPETTPWLPSDYPAGMSVSAQRDDPGSVLWFVRDLISLRRRIPELSGGAYATLASPPGSWVWSRGVGVTVALNLSDTPVTCSRLRGEVEFATERGRVGDSVEGLCLLAAYEGVVVVRSQ